MVNSTILAIPLLVSIACLIVNMFIKRSLLCVSNIVIAWFVTSFTIGIFLDVFHVHYQFVNINAMCYLSLVMSIFYFPLISLQEQELDTIIHPYNQRLNVLIWICIITGCLAVLFFLPYIPQVFQSNIKIRRIDLSVYQEFLIDRSIFNTLAIIFSSFFHISILFAFYCYVFKIRSYRIIFLLLISSLSEPLHMFTQYGRDGVVSWIIVFVICYVFFYKFMQYEQRRLIRKIFILCAFPILMGFWVISESRFEDNNINAIFEYIGCSSRYFNMHYDLSNILPHGKGLLTMPLLNRIATISNLSDDEETGNQFRNKVAVYALHAYGQHSNVFGTFVADMLYDFGKLMTLVLAIMLTALTTFFLRLRGEGNSLDFSQLILVILYCYFLMIGLFYFRLGLSPQGNFLIISTLATSIYMRWKPMSSTEYVKVDKECFEDEILNKTHGTLESNMEPRSSTLF